MAENDILNPTRGWWRAIGDNPNPSYSSPRHTTNNNALARARMGAPYSRDTMNQGYGFEFYYINRPWTTVLRLQRFYHQYKGGYFTYIDWDGGGRHHVGRFVTPPSAMQVANDKYVVQGLLFQEIPRARMQQYPSDFTNWSCQINVVDDFLNSLVATSVADATTGASWVVQLNPALTGASSSDPTAYEVYGASLGAGDYAQVEYVGWGFQMKLRLSSSFGAAKLYVDGVATIDIDLTSGAFSGSLPTGMTCAGGVVTYTQMPLDVHRVKLVADGTGPVAYPPLKVIV